MIVKHSLLSVGFRGAGGGRTTFDATTASAFDYPPVVDQDTMVTVENLSRYGMVYCYSRTTNF